LYEGSKEFEEMSTVIGKNRKLLLESFEHFRIEKSTTRVNVDNAIKVLSNFLRKFELNEMKFHSILRPARIRPGKEVDYKILLDIFKNRVNNKDTFPKH
jgi:hypothetical protein